MKMVRGLECFHRRHRMTLQRKHESIETVQFQNEINKNTHTQSRYNSWFWDGKLFTEDHSF